MIFFKGSYRLAVKVCKLLQKVLLSPYGLYFPTTLVKIKINFFLKEKIIKILGFCIKVFFLSINLFCIKREGVSFFRCIIYADIKIIANHLYDVGIRVLKRGYYIPRRINKWI